MVTTRRPNPKAKLFVAGMVCCIVLMPGCRSTNPENETARASGIMFSGNTPGQISEMIVEVFREHAYTLAQPGMTSLVFEKKAPLGSNIAYGNWIGDKPVYLRARVSILPAGEARFQAQCRGVLVRDINTTTEEELKLGSAQKHDCRKLLEEAARRLGSGQR